MLITKKISISSILQKSIPGAILFLLLMVLSWFFLRNLGAISKETYSFVFAFFISVYVMLYRRKSIDKLLKKIISSRLLVPISSLVLLLTGLLIRLYFYINFTYMPVSDPETFFSAGKNIANGESMLGNSYVAFFPYLSGYNNMLGLSMRLFDDPWLATIMLNSLFDVMGGVILYLLAKKIFRSESKTPLFISCLWVANPFGIVFSVISIPVALVNFFILATALVAYYLIQSLLARKQRNSLLLATLLGVTAGIGNCFRPIFTIMLVALVGVMLYMCLARKTFFQGKRFILLLLASLFIVVMSFFTIQSMNLSLVKKQTGLVPAPSASGWSIYVGSNLESTGKWNIEDEGRMDRLCVNTKTYQQCHDLLQNEGIKRLKDQSLLELFIFFVKKLDVLSGNQNNLYNAYTSMPGYSSSSLRKVMDLYTIIFIQSLFLICILQLHRYTKRNLGNDSINLFILFIACSVIGIFFSTVLIETSERYAQVMYPLFFMLIIALTASGRYPTKKEA